jgi:hypothetical protein
MPSLPSLPSSGSALLANLAEALTTLAGEVAGRSLIRQAHDPQALACVSSADAPAVEEVSVSGGLVVL